MNESYKFLYESVKNKFDFLRDADNALDTKVGILITGIVGILTIYVTLASITDPYKIKLAVVALVLTLVSLSVLIWIQYPKKYMTLLDDENLINEYLNKNETDLMLHLISDAQFAFTENKKVLELKVKYYKLAIFILFFSLPMLLLSGLPVINLSI